MTDDRQLSAVLETWLAEGPIRMPDRVFDRVADRIDRQRQRPAWRLDRRRTTMNPTMKLTAAIVAVVLVAVVGYNLLPGGSTGVGGPAPSPSPTAVPTATPVPSQLVEGLLAAGTYQTQPFVGSAAALTITFTVPGGWSGFPTWGLLGPRNTDAPDGTGIGFLEAVALYGDPCRWDAAGTGAFPQPGDVAVGPTVDDLVNALRANTSYAASAPTDVAIDGYLGKQLDLQMPSDVDFAACDKATGADEGAYFVWSPPAESDNGLFAQGPGNRWRLRILDVSGNRIIIVTTGYAATPTEDQLAAEAIVDSIEITP